MEQKKDLKILVVDDAPELLDITICALKKAEYKVFSAVNSSECMQVLQSEKPDIILLNAMLPDTKGKNLCKRIKSNPEFSSVYIILYSSFKKGSDTIAYSMADGADDYIRRSDDQSELLARVKAASRIIIAERDLTVSNLLWQAAFDGIKDSVFLIDSERYIIRTNKSAIELLKKSEAELLGHSCYEIMHCSSGHIEDCPFIRMKNSKKRESMLLSVDEKWFEIIVDPLFDDGGNLQGAVHFIIDITERKISEDKIRKLNLELEQRVTECTAKLEAANRELQSFAYSVSHDLRAPLRAIDGFSKFVIEDYGTKIEPEGKRLLGLIRSNTQKMDQLIVNILALSKVSRSELIFSKIEMKKLVLSMLNEVAAPEVQEKVSVIVDPLPDTIADPIYMKQVWINLISNAIKFSSFKKKPEIKIGGYTEKGFHVYYIRDNGVGFNPEYAHKLFGVFQRLHKNDEFEGTGVGLAIVQRIILRHGGKVWAEGFEGKGATFYFSLPV